MTSYRRAFSSFFPLILCVVVFLVACQGGEERSGEGSESVDVRPAEEQFESIQAFLAGSEGDQQGSHQVVFVGIDGAAWRFVDPLIDRGILPNLKRIKEEGVYGTLRSVPCYVSPPAWASMLCGYSPAKTGVYTFGKWDRETEVYQGVNAEDVAVPSVWDVASLAGKKVAVTNVPLTYPVHPVNGIMVSGLMTPIAVGDVVAFKRVSTHANVKLAHVAPQLSTYSPAGKMVLADELNTAIVWRIDTTDDLTRNYDRVVLKVYPKREGVKEKDTDGVYIFDIGQYSPWVPFEATRNGEVEKAWFKLGLVKRPDGRFETWWSQTLFDVRDTAGQFTYPKALADDLYSRFGYYLPSKFLKEWVMPDLTMQSVKYASFFYDYDDWDLYSFVFTQSDNIHHLEGFTPRAEEIYHIIDRFLGKLMEQLPEESTLIIASDHGFRAFEYGVDLNRYFETKGLLKCKPDGPYIDYDQTMVFHNMWYLYFNHALLTRENLESLNITINDSEKPVDAFVRHLQEIGRNVTSPYGRKQFPVEFTPVNDDMVGDDPDMLVEGAYDGYMVEFWNLKRAHGEVVWRLVPTEVHNHDRDGVYLMWGKHVKKGLNAGTHAIEDIAPTMLYLLNLPTAEDMDGRTMYDALEPAFISKRTSYVVPNYKEIPRDFVAAAKEKESLEQKLRSLGYVNP